MRDFRRYLIMLLIVVMLTLMQSSLFHAWTLMNTIPDLVLIFIVMVGLYNGIEEGVAAGLVSGIITGCFSSGPVAAFCLAYGITGFIAGIVKDRIHPDNFVVPLFTASGCALLSSVLITIMAAALGYYKSLYVLRVHLLPLLILSAFFAIPMGYVVRSKFLTSRRPLI
jgi:rod shape-determining protein MreD